MEFKDRLKMLRRNYTVDGKRLTQEKLGDVLGYKYTSVSNYESGRNEPCIRDLIKLSKFFGVSLDYLVCSSDKTIVDTMDNELYNLCCSFTPEEQKRLIGIIKEVKEMKEMGN
ncbi:MAG: helix-turn-helix transcriptional regulator [Lachnospiraceae bacterium]|nr:helix-turn-helix transcriptional regulator [Lachnospiraceae bacterium]